MAWRLLMRTPIPTIIRSGQAPYKRGAAAGSNVIPPPRFRFWAAALWMTWRAGALFALRALGGVDTIILRGAEGVAG